MWVPEQQLGQNWAKLLLKCRNCHFKHPRIQKLHGGQVLIPPRKLELLTRLSRPLGNTMAMYLCPPKTNWQAMPVNTSISISIKTLLWRNVIRVVLQVLRGRFTSQLFNFFIDSAMYIVNVGEHSFRS